VTILEDRDGKIRVGIEAPKEKKIYRQEVYDRICRENREASQWDREKLEALQAVLPEKTEPSG
jgi:carbon storage regulator